MPNGMQWLCIDITVNSSSLATLKAVLRKYFPVATSPNAVFMVHTTIFNEAFTVNR